MLMEPKVLLDLFVDFGSGNSIGVVIFVVVVGKAEERFLLGTCSSFIRSLTFFLVINL